MNIETEIMKTIQEVLAEIDRRIEKENRGAEYLGFSSATLYSELRDLKEFILSGECEHEWRYMPDKTFPHHKCTKCRVTR